MLKILLRRTSPFLIILVCLLISYLLIKAADKPQQENKKVKIPLVEISIAQPKDITIQISSYGIVEPKFKTKLITEVQGRVETITPIFSVGTFVKKGQVLARIESSDYQTDFIQAQATLAQAQAALDEELARGKVAELEFKDFKQGVAPKLGLRLPQLKKEQANVKFAQAAVSRAQRNLERTTIKAPFDGIIRARDIELGQYVTTGLNLGELYGTQQAQVRLPISSEKLGFLSSMETPQGQVTFIGDFGGKLSQWEGEITRSERVIDPQNRMLYLVAEVADPYRLTNKTNNNLPLKYGTFVNAKIEGKQVKGIVSLPRHIVRNNQVAIVKPDNTIEFRQVNIVHSDLEQVFIQNSFSQGEQISLTPSNNLNNGQLVRILNNFTPPVIPLDETDKQALVIAGDK